jgi:hypothetical protein
VSVVRPPPYGPYDELAVLLLLQPNRTETRPEERCVMNGFDRWARGRCDLSWGFVIGLAVLTMRLVAVDYGAPWWVTVPMLVVGITLCVRYWKNGVRCI